MGSIKSADRKGAAQSDNVIAFPGITPPNDSNTAKPDTTFCVTPWAAYPSEVGLFRDCGMPRERVCSATGPAHAKKLWYVSGEIGHPDFATARLSEARAAVKERRAWEYFAVPVVAHAGGDAPLRAARRG